MRRTLDTTVSRGEVGVAPDDGRVLVIEELADGVERNTFHYQPRGEGVAKIVVPKRTPQDLFLTK